MRDVTGVLVGRVPISAARMAVHAGKALWRGRGRWRYLLLAQSAGGKNRWMIQPSTAFDGVGRLFAAELRRHSDRDSWRFACGAADAH